MSFSNHTIDLIQSISICLLGLAGIVHMLRHR